MNGRATTNKFIFSASLCVAFFAEEIGTAIKHHKLESNRPAFLFLSLIDHDKF